MALSEVIPWVVSQVATSIVHNWLFLALGVMSAAALKVYVGTDRITDLFQRRTGYAVVGSVGAAVLTPFCSCGTTAVVLSMIATTAPWAPIVAFMVASPLTSPDELFVSAGLFGWPFAIYFFASSIILGFAAGAAVAEFEMRRDPLRLAELGREAFSLGRTMLVLFVGFAAIGYGVIAIVPTAWLTTLLGGSSPLSVVIAATLGVPFYVSSEGSLPLVTGLMAGGMGTGPAIAFLITGAGTSIGAMSGGLLIARWRVLAIIIGSLWVGAIVLGLIAGLLL